jgi:AraC family transcriptional activator of pyochelin receptor
MILQWSQKEYAPCSFQAYTSGSNIAPKQSDYRMALSEQIAHGYVETQRISSDMFLMTSEMGFNKDTMFQEQYVERKVLQLSFCMEGICEWHYRGDVRYQVSPTECSLQCGILKQCDSCYQAGQTYRSVGICLEKERRDFFMEYLESVHLVNTSGNICSKIFASTPRMRLILQQLLEAPADRRLKKLYLEGKVLELLTTFCSEAVGKSRDDLNISKEDYRCILQARELIDRQFLHPLTISKVAEASYLSETKLKQGFKTCFGCTVYDYIIEKRMEMACRLLQGGKHKVKDVVWMVGYSNHTHFAETFRRRYGVNPSDVVQA